MRKLVHMFFAILFILSSTGCSYNVNVEVNKPEYDGGRLHIGVIGEAPNYNFERITFQKVTLDQLGATNQGAYDGYMITEEFFVEASLQKYKQAFKNLTVPVFFINLHKLYWLYLDEDAHYDDYPIVDSVGYTQGFIPNDDGSVQLWRIELKNYEATEENIRDMYVEVFHNLDEFKKDCGRKSKVSITVCYDHDQT
ncbi:hypothetical protein [Aureibacillus halotolerans]|uniref:Lipoprotein n=1 Tax=Aureibacillus halotolerans TaxID=1508390 RepID=A0A4R6TX58_9BACI|nr:hypothetical protein [Aureibacillus halotolerans]TDQ33792.1 hypothetical protein EV213_12824 [Aureibacillus halotolerans]